MNKMVVCVSSYFNHHQKPFSDAMYEALGDKYRFIETSTMKEERKKLGYGTERPSYVIPFENFKKSEADIINLINDADIVITGSAPERLLSKRKKAKKIIIRYSERPLKKGLEITKYLPRLIRWHKRNPKSRPIYLLCSSAYTASDYARFGLFKSKCYKWGYFPECQKYDDVNSLISSKRKNSILWCGRFIDWKHPEYAIELAQKLKADGYDFELNMIGTGEMYDEIAQKIKDLDLEENVNMLGSMKPEQVRAHMEQSEIFIFTSNRQEGWGAVLNESMNSACAVVANNAIGAAPYLIKDGENGYLYYNDKNSNELYEKVKLLLDNKEKRVEFSKKAYETIANEWNAEDATQRLLNLFEKMLNKEDCSMLYKDGPCSKA